MIKNYTEFVNESKNDSTKFYPTFITHEYTDKPIIKLSVQIGDGRFQPFKIMVINGRYINTSYDNKDVPDKVKKAVDWILNNIDTVESYLSKGKHLKAKEQNWSMSVDKRNYFTV